VISIPELRWVARLAWVVAAPAWFVWLASDDRGVGAIMAVAAIVCVAFALSGIARWRGGKGVGRRRWLLESMAVGLLTGGLVPPVAVLLILIKISLHSQGTPGFTLGDIGGILNRLPVWALAGVLTGEAMGLIGAALGRGE
jgi:hypothetical protein